jgi:hypothetical protein
VKLWQEESDGEKAYAARADEVPVLLARELTRAGIRLGWTWRLRVVLYERRRARRARA